MQIAWVGCRKACKSGRTRPNLAGFLKDMILAELLGGRLEQRQATLRGVLAAGHASDVVLAVDIDCSSCARKDLFLEE